MNEYVETCPHCGGDNFGMQCVEIEGYVVKCQHCGEEIFLCDECFHAADNEKMKCDWEKTETGGRCWRGVTVNKAE